MLGGMTGRKEDIKGGSSKRGGRKDRWQRNPAAGV